MEFLQRLQQKTIKKQMNHFMLSIIKYVKLEGVKLMTNNNHFAIKTRIYNAALKTAYWELKTIKGIGYPNA
jgi:poly-D-alanine transfer protein DltD